jgi:hypothetical protein
MTAPNRRPSVEYALQDHVTRIRNLEAVASGIKIPHAFYGVDWQWNATTTPAWGGSTSESEPPPVSFQPAAHGNNAGVTTDGNSTFSSTDTSVFAPVSPTSSSALIIVSTPGFYRWQIDADIFINSASAQEMLWIPYTTPQLNSGLTELDAWAEGGDQNGGYGNARRDVKTTLFASWGGMTATGGFSYAGGAPHELHVDIFKVGAVNYVASIFVKIYIWQLGTIGLFTA